MGLPSSGQLSLNDIKTELGAASTNVSLGSMSNTAGFSEPDAISDFYGYSAATGYLGAFSEFPGSSGSEACATTTTINLYKNGSSSTPVIGDSLFTDANLTTPYDPVDPGSWYKYVDLENNNTSYFLLLLNNGYIENVGVCR